MEIILTALALSPSALIRVVDQVKPNFYSEKLSPERFNLVEMVAHVADLEDVFLDRMRLAHEFPGKTAEGIDFDARAAEHHYADKEIHHELDVFDNRRRDTVDFLRTLGPEDWQKTFVDPNWGSMSIAQVANIIVAHDVYHLEQASQYMR